MKSIIKKDVSESNFKNNKNNYSKELYKPTTSNHHHSINCNCEVHDEGCCGCNHTHHSNKQSIVLLIRIIISLILLVVSIFVSDIIQYILLSISYIVIGYDIVFYAFKNIIKGKLFDENFLMTIASLTALVVYIVNKDANIDGFDGVLVILLYQIGEFIQHKVVDKSKKSISSMLELDIVNVIKIEDNKEIIISAEKIKINDILKILPGEKIPTDGMIIKGSSTINSSMITGESKPIEVYENDLVSSGCINNDGLLYIKAITTLENSTASKIKKMIEEAGKNKANHEKFITKFAKYYTPIVIFISLFVIFIIPLILGFKENFYNYLYKGLTIMVVSCPCALVISIPLSYFIGIGKAARHSILIKGSSHIESLAKCNLFAFDKTGTLTKGNFKVESINSNNREFIEKILYSCEKNFTHPIAKSIVKELNQVNQLNIEEIKNIPGYGIKAYHDNKMILIGNDKLLKKYNIAYDKQNNNNNNNNTIIHVSYDNTYLGNVIIIDELKENSIDTVKKLNNKYQTCLISGDNKDIVEGVAEKLSINNYHYSKTPEEKLNIVKQLKNKNKVAFIGDGINDAACLIESDCGIAMRSLGSDIAINSSDIVIMDDDISNVTKAIKISKKTMKTVIVNMIFSILVKVGIMIITMFVKLPIWVAIIGDVGVCLLAILNSLTIMYGKYIK